MVVSSAAIGVVLSHHVMMRIPVFCTLLSLCVLLLDAVLECADPYSITGLTYKV